MMCCTWVSTVRTEMTRTAAIWLLDMPWATSVATSRSRRVRRLLAVSVAAVAVMIAPTACNYGGPAQMDMPSHSGHMDGMNMDDPAQQGAPEEHQVVPVANQVPAWIDAVTSEDIQRTARTYLTKANRTVIDRKPAPPAAPAAAPAAATGEKK